MRLSQLGLAPLLAVIALHGCARSQATACGRSETPSHYVYRMTTNAACFEQPLTGRCSPRGDPDTNPWRPRFSMPEGDLEKRYGDTLRCFAERGDQVAIYLVSWENHGLAVGQSTSRGPDDILLNYLPDPKTVDPQLIRRDCLDRRTEQFYACSHGLPENWLLAHLLIMENPGASADKLLLLPKIAQLAEAGGFIVPRERAAERLKNLAQ